MNEIEKKLNNLEDEIEKMREKIKKNNLSNWKCSCNLNISEEELKNWNTDNPDNMWKIKIMK